MQFVIFGAGSNQPRVGGITPWKQQRSTTSCLSCWVLLYQDVQLDNELKPKGRKLKKWKVHQYRWAQPSQLINSCLTRPRIIRLVMKKDPRPRLFLSENKRWMFQLWAFYIISQWMEMFNFRCKKKVPLRERTLLTLRWKCTWTECVSFALRPSSSPFFSVNIGTVFFTMSYFTAQVLWTGPLVIFEKFYFFFFFFQHFLQQYRRHRIHSFTNTKHTTTLAAAAVEGREGGGGEGDGGMLRVWRLPVQSWPSILSIIVRKNLPFGGCHFGTFLQHSSMRTMEKAFFWDM